MLSTRRQVPFQFGVMILLVVFLYIEDCIDAIILLTQRKITGVVNVSTNKLISIRDLAMQIGGVTKYTGTVLFDKTQLTGQL